ncbi:PREDICTED: membrane-bound transcription factor site-2 protease [Ceratosolen solmsi marchali]|uniref:Membrane-bound transcription factor site-2 protease n=1 Tax=Ceratosolen solmsi marchali TaxID=326594 RepID=A0AAJ6YGX0_9HYME|nr:PREDICTED: membrane-bound transcription factor site-2 protease [Ceratosolen solmsi marchali]
MEAHQILILIALAHFSLFFFNTIFVSCMHVPYLNLLKKIGLEIQLLRLKWFTTIFNRSLMKWGLNRSKFWSLWYNAGLIATIILFPISMVVILKMTFNIWLFNSSSSNENNEQVLELMIPGVDIPYNEIGYYILSLILCSIVHEFGHAMAAVREDVRLFGIGAIIFFIIPVAFIQISDEQLDLLPFKNRLRILCAGIWHNIVLAVLAITVLGSVTFFFSLFFIKNSGVFVKNISPNSPLLGPSGLSTGDVVYKINDCIVRNSTNWRTCILQATKTSTPGYCVTDKMVKELDKSFLIQHKNTDVHNCCDQHSKDKGYLCFEHLEGFDIQTSRASTHYCLPTRAIVESSHNLCQNNDQCFMLNDLCMKPTLDNMTKIVQLQRYGHKDVLFFGYPSEIYYTTELSNWVPRFSFLSPNFPEALILFCKYIAVFSSGLAIINALPCFYFDGERITAILTDALLKNKIHEQNVRKIIASIITSTFTLLLGLNLINMYLNKT